VSAPERVVFRVPMRVYWEDTDAGGVVFYANYLKFFERARTEWLRSFGHSQEQLRIDTGTLFVVTDTSLRYLRPARLDDLIEVTVEVERATYTRISFIQQAWRGNDLLTEGSIRVATVHAGTFKPRAIPNELLQGIG
jgi:acyl-CoA thioester hydrolase